MLAADTNVIVRYLTGDDPVQSAQARALVDGTDIFVGHTVLLETGWVLRRVYGYTDADLVPALRAFSGLPHVTMQDAGRVAMALDWVLAGMDFADVLHLAKASGCDAFISCDAALAKTAKRVRATPVRAPS